MIEVPVKSIDGTVIGSMELLDSVAAEIVLVAKARVESQLRFYPIVNGDTLEGSTLAFEPANKHERPRLVWCPPGCEEAAMKLLEECEVPQ